VIDGLAQTTADEPRAARVRRMVGRVPKALLAVAMGSIVLEAVLLLLLGLAGGGTGDSVMEELNSDVHVGWMVAEPYLLPVGVAGALLAALLLGGLAWWRHWVVRLLLWCSERMPWRFTRLLEEGRQRILMQRTGGGYRFFHDLFRDYLATHGEPAPAP